MGFKDDLKNDLNEVFFNPEEYCEPHIINGKKIKCIFDDNKLREKQGGAALAIAESSVMLFVQTSEIGAKQPAGSPLIIDGKTYFVDEWDEDAGMSTVTLHQNIGN